MTTMLTATLRDKTGKSARSLSTEGLMPAVVYGPKQEAIAISIPLSDFKRVLRDAGESTVIELSGVGKSALQVLIHDVDHDPVTTIPRHADFYAIEKGAKIEVAVPLSFIGESPAVKLGLNLVKVMHELEIEADAANLPHGIEVDISSLVSDGDQIHVSNLHIPAGVTVKHEDDEVVALIQAVEVEPEEPAAELDMNAIEVEKKGKDDSGEEAA